MLKEVEQLLVLQERDRKVRGFRQELKSAPGTRKGLEEKLAKAQKGLEDAKQKGRVLEVERNQLANEAASKREQIRKYETQKSSTRKNDEFQALNTAIDHLNRDISKLEDRELELMEGSEGLKPEVAQAEQNLQAVTKTVTEQQQDLAAKIKNIEGQIHGAEGDRAQAATQVEEDLLEVYERLFTSKGDAVVALENGICTGCHMKVTANTLQRVRAGREITHCEQCGRILYYSEY